MNGSGGGFYNAWNYGDAPPAPPPPAPAVNYSYGWSVPPRGGLQAQQHHEAKPQIGYDQWIAPPSTVASDPYGYMPAPHPVMPPMIGSGFPSKGAGAAIGRGRGLPRSRGPGAPRRGGPGLGFNRKRPLDKKPLDPTGKTPAMLMNELFKDVLERYDLETPADINAKYRCILTVAGKEFSMVASSKKLAKQRAAEILIRSLRPDIPVTPFDEGSGATTKVLPKEVVPAAVPANTFQIGPVAVPAAASIPKGRSGPPPKKIKAVLSPVEAALSVLDCLRKMCAEKAADPMGPYEPDFEFEDVTVYTPDVDPQKTKKKMKCSLKFPKQEREFIYEGVGRSLPKDMVCAMALREMFGVTSDEIRQINRRYILHKPKMSSLPAIVTLYHAAQVGNCDVTFNVEPEGKALGTGPSLYICKCTLIDHTQNDQQFEFESPPCNSKQDSKDSVARKVLREFFDINLSTLVGPGVQAVDKNNSGIDAPAQRLQTLLARRFKRNEVAKYEDAGSSGTPNTPGFFFKFKVTIEGKEFEGTGKSKKAAKNAAAANALKSLFNVDCNSDGTVANSTMFNTCSKRCFEINEFVRREYFQMCDYYGIRPSPEMAAFVFVNDKEEKRIVSIASCHPATVNGSKLIDAKGTSLFHLDPIVLARRSLVRYMISQLGKSDDPRCLFEKKEDGRFKLKDNIRLVLYSVYAPGTRFSAADAPKKTLSILGPNGFEPSPTELQTIEEIKALGNVRIHCAADKIFKWTNLGVQGSLLSTILDPVRLDCIYFGSQYNTSDENLAHAFFNRINPVTRPVEVESNRVVVPMFSCAPHVWTKDFDALDFLNPESGLSMNGTPSRLSKAAIFEAFRAMSVVPKGSSYVEVKQSAKAYNVAKDLLYDELVKKGLGKWQKKPVELVDFSLSEEKNE